MIFVVSLDLFKSGPLFRANVAQPQRLSTKIWPPGTLQRIRLKCNHPGLAIPSVGSTRASGQDDGSLHKLIQMIRFRLLN